MIQGRLHVYECPPEQRAAVVEVINDQSFGVDHEPGTGRPPAETVLQLWVDYNASFWTHGQARFVADAIITAAPGATFATWSCPSAGYGLGYGVTYAPDLGAFRHECDEEGHPYFAQRDVVLLLHKPMRERIEAYGQPWYWRIYDINRRNRLAAPEWDEEIDDDDLPF